LRGLRLKQHYHLTSIKLSDAHGLGQDLIFPKDSIACNPVSESEPGSPWGSIQRPAAALLQQVCPAFSAALKNRLILAKPEKEADSGWTQTQAIRASLEGRAPFYLAA
jgi:hypothetical protein